MNKPSKQLPIYMKLILSIYAICFFAGGLQHCLDIINNGIFPYQTVPFLFNFYLTSLAILDLLVSIFICINPLYSLVLAMLIMASDVTVDFYVGYHYWHITVNTNLKLQLLVIFALFVFFSAPLLIVKLKSIK